MEPGGRIVPMLPARYAHRKMEEGQRASLRENRSPEDLSPALGRRHIEFVVRFSNEAHAQDPFPYGSLAAVSLTGRPRLI